MRKLRLHVQWIPAGSDSETPSPTNMHPGHSLSATSLTSPLSPHSPPPQYPRPQADLAHTYDWGDHLRSDSRLNTFLDRYNFRYGLTLPDPRLSAVGSSMDRRNHVAAAGYFNSSYQSDNTQSRSSFGSQGDRASLSPSPSPSATSPTSTMFSASSRDSSPFSLPSPTTATTSQGKTSSSVYSTFASGSSSASSALDQGINKLKTQLSGHLIASRLYQSPSYTASAPPSTAGRLGPGSGMIPDREFTIEEAMKLMLRYEESQLRVIGIGPNVYSGRWVLGDSSSSPVGNKLRFEVFRSVAGDRWDT